MSDDRWRILDLFSGIGGMSLGLERAGMRTVAFCERDDFCRAVLAHHWPDVPIHDDVRTLTGGDVGRADLICGGFPCQPWSYAGKRRGTSDDRDLWPEMLRVVAEVRPRWVLGENVAGFVSEPMGLDRCVADLEAEGYEVRPFMVPACAVGAPHRRDRIWIVAHAPDVRGPAIKRGEPDGAGELLDGVAPDAERQRLRALRPGGALGEKGAAESGEAERQRVRADDRPMGEPITDAPSPRPSDGTDRTERPAPLAGELERPDRRQPQPQFRRVDDGTAGWLDGRAVPPLVARGVPNRVQRLRALGNSVVPQVVEAIGRAIMSAEEER